MSVLEIARRVRREQLAQTGGGDDVHEQVAPQQAQAVESVIYLDVPCRCDEKPYPHFRHADGSGPGSGLKLDANDPHQAHVSRGRK